MSYRPTTPRAHTIFAAIAIGVAIATALSTPGLAQGAHHPFAVGVNEGAANVTGIGGWILAQESWFYRLLTGAMRAVKENGSAAWMLAALSFGYGVFHAAGPGHGKAVIAAYMVANERVLRRGLVIALAAALLQGFVAVALVGVAFLVLGTTAKHMTAAANMIEIASYAGVVILGAVLVVSKSAAVAGAWRQAPAPARAFASLQAAGLGGHFLAEDCSAPRGRDSFGLKQSKTLNVIDSTCVERDAGGKSVSNFPHPALAHGPGCGHVHAADPSALGADFSWSKALLTVAAAGSRPCSGAILVLVFASAQGIFLAGCGAALAMSLGVAITTGALATSAVFAKKAVAHYAQADSWRALMAGRLFEAAAACAVLIFGLALLSAALSGGALRG